MAKKRQLKDAMVDEIVVEGGDASLPGRPLNTRRCLSAATVVAAAILGLIGGFWLRRWIRWI